MKLQVEIVKKVKTGTIRVEFALENEVLGILGRSGCGKSVTLRCIAGTLQPDEGRILLDDRVLYDSGKKICLKARERVHGARVELGSVDPGGGVEGAHPVDVHAVQIEAVAEPEDAARGRRGVEGLRGNVDPEVVGRGRPGVSVRVLIGISVAARHVGEVGEVVEGGVGVALFGGEMQRKRTIRGIHGTRVAERWGRLVQRRVKLGAAAGREGGVAPVLLGIGIGGVGGLPTMVVIHGVVHVAVHGTIVA